MILILALVQELLKFFRWWGGGGGGGGLKQEKIAKFSNIDYLLFEQFLEFLYQTKFWEKNCSCLLTCMLLG